LNLKNEDLSQKYFFQIIFLLTSQKSETLANREVIKITPGKTLGKTRENPCCIKTRESPLVFRIFDPVL